MKLVTPVVSSFRDLRQFRLFAMLVLASFCCGLLVLGRSYLNRHDLTHVNTLKDLYWFRAPTFVFLLFNLFLALIRMNPPDHSCSKYRAVTAIYPFGYNGRSKNP